METIRRRVHRQLDPRAWGRPGLSPVNQLMVVLILAATVLAIVETEPVLYDRYGRQFEGAEAE